MPAWALTAFLRPCSWAGPRNPRVGGSDGQRTGPLMLARVIVPPALLLLTAVGAWTVPDDATWAVYVTTALLLWTSAGKGRAWC